MFHACRALAAPALLLAMAGGACATPPSLESLFADPAYRDVTISPNGRYFAVIAPVDGRDILVTLKSDKSAVVGRFGFRESNESVLAYDWLKDEHLLIQPATVYGWRDAPSWYGDLYAARADGQNFRAIYGYRAGEMQTGSRIKKAELTRGWGYLVSDLPEHPEDILVASYPWVSTGGSRPSVQRISLSDGVSRKLLGAPAADAQFIASPGGDIRLATARDKDDVERVYEFLPEQSSWQELARNSVKRGDAMKPVGMSADGRTAYYLSNVDSGTTGLYALDLASREHRLVYRNDADNVDDVELDPWTGELLWVTLASEHGFEILNAGHQLAKSRQRLDKAFPGTYVRLTSVTRDYKKAVFHVYSDRDPGAWYSLNTETREAKLELEAHAGINPDKLLPMRKISLRARDGLVLHGYYTASAPEGGRKPPLVLLVHGGPHARDEWEFKPETQMLATRGYAVLQVNFRGSKGYGHDFEAAGRGQWGRAMQDDLTDATQWAIAEGLADPARICIMGTSYGGYASLMGVIREPKLYQCAIDMFGVTDLTELFNSGDIPDQLSGRGYLKDALGTDRSEWDARSPAKLAAQIQAPVLIIAGGQDKRVPIAHSKMMEKALKKAGKPVETLYFASEGHGFSLLEHRVEAYQKVLDFLARNIGTGEPVP